MLLAEHYVGLGRPPNQELGVCFYCRVKSFASGSSRLGSVRTRFKIEKNGVRHYFFRFYVWLGSRGIRMGERPNEFAPKLFETDFSPSFLFPLHQISRTIHRTKSKRKDPHLLALLFSNSYRKRMEILSSQTFPFNPPLSLAKSGRR